MNRDAYISILGGIDYYHGHEEQEDTCPECKTHFRAVWNSAAGFKDQESVFCPKCRHECFTVMASDIPTTFMIEDRE